jgi:capsid portal protein
MTTKFNKWKLKDSIVLFPIEWNKQEVLDWVNAKYIRVCSLCDKLDVSYDHFNHCNPQQEKVNRINRDMWLRD